MLDFLFRIEYNINKMKKKTNIKNTEGIKMIIAETQLLEAAVLGTQAHKNGAKCIPFQDSKLMEMLAGQ